MEQLIGKIKCLLGKHNEHTSFSFKTGACVTTCTRCNKTLYSLEGFKKDR